MAPVVVGARAPVLSERNEREVGVTWGAGPIWQWALRASEGRRGRASVLWPSSAGLEPKLASGWLGCALCPWSEVVSDQAGVRTVFYINLFEAKMKPNKILKIPR